MTNLNIDLAREWAKYATRMGTSRNDARAAIDLIDSLPDEWIDAEKVRELLHWREVVEQTPIKSTEAHLIALLHALLTPSLPTLADMTPEEREACQWMQCDDDPGYVIMQVGETVSRVLLSDGNYIVRGNRTITPLPDLPKLEWPSLSVSGESEAVSVETEESECLPRPEDVPPGEAWIVMNEGHRNQWVGTRDDSGTTNWPWALVKIDGTDYALSQDVEVTLVSRLVPERKENA